MCKTVVRFALPFFSSSFFFGMAYLPLQYAYLIKSHIVFLEQSFQLMFCGKGTD